MSYSKTILVGNLGRDPEIRSTNNGVKVAMLSVATSERWKDRTSGEAKERTEWHRVVVFVPALMNYIEQAFQKGTLVQIEGQNRTRKWTSQDGIERYTTEVVVQPYNGTVKLLANGRPRAEGAEPPPSDDHENGNGYDGGGSSGPATDLDDEIPF